MALGFTELLDLHNTVELSSLCGMLGVRIERRTKNAEKKAMIAAMIAKRIEETSKPTAVYTTVLNYIWEGTLFEYLRAKGQPLNSTASDPRGFVIALWRKRTAEVVPFDPYYVPRTLQNRSGSDKRSADIEAILDTMEEKELAVKTAETRIRREHDYTNVLSYLQASSALRCAEKEGRTYLIGETEIERARAGHGEETVSMLNVQLTEMEGRHEGVKRSWVENQSHLESVGETYVAQLAENQSDRRFHNQLLRRQILDVRSSSEDFSEDFPGEEEDDDEEKAGSARAKSDACLRANGYEDINHENDTEALIRRLGVRNRRETHALRRELAEAREREETNAAGWAESKQYGEEEKGRADGAENKLERLVAQGDQFKDRVAAREAVVETEANEYFDIAADATYSATDMSHRISSVLPSLQALLLAPDAVTVAHAATVLEGLGVMTHEAIVSHTENNTMMREEAACREAEIMATVKVAKAGKGKAGGAGGKAPGAKAGGKKGTGKKAAAKKKK